jgi:general secretion pathway protein A
VYREFYGLVRAPFEMTPDPSFLYLGETHREGLAMLHYAIEARKGFLALTGEVGTGKTTLVHALLSQLKSSSPSAFIFNPRLEPLDFLRMLFDEFGIEAECRTKAEYLMALNHYLTDCLARDQIALLIVDEAQNLSPEMLEEVRLLSNLETPRSKLLQIMLVGQPELDEMLDRPELRQLRQRIVLRHQLRPFDADELDHYVAERLRLAGYTGKGIFTRSARKELHAVTGGVPRLVNVVCDSALLLGYSRELQEIGADIIHESAVELRMADPKARKAKEPRGAGRSARNPNPLKTETQPARVTQKRQKRRFNWFGLFD